MRDNSDESTLNSCRTINTVIYTALLSPAFSKKSEGTRYSAFRGEWCVKSDAWCVAPCERNSSYSFGPVLLQLYRCFNHGLKICMCFLQNPSVHFFFHFFHIFNLDFFAWFRVCSGNMVSIPPPTVLYRPF